MSPLSRVDYLGHEYWTDLFDIPTVVLGNLTISHGTVEIHVVRDSVNVEGAIVNLFSESDVFLGRIQTTNASGITSFVLPADTFKFRADESNYQRWSDLVTIIAGQVTSIELNLADAPPIVTISADREIIVVGDTLTLTWNSMNTDSASIDQGIGEVDVNGSFTVEPGPSVTTTYTITVEGAGGTETNTVTVTVIPIGIYINSPSDGDTILRPDVMVKGTIDKPLEQEMGITVNGVIAFIDGNQFVANHVPLEEDDNTITATAIDMEGNTVTDSITVYAETTGDFIRITADPDSGVAPFGTTLEVETTFTFTNEPVFDYTGPDLVEFPDQGEYNVTITTPGVYYFTVEATDDQSYVYTDTLAVEALDLAQLDALLTAKWGGSKSKLVAGNVEDALQYIHGTSRDKYESIYEFLGDDLPTLAAQMQDIELIYAEGDRAKYRISRDHDIDGEIVTLTYYIYYSKDVDGLWKIESY